MTTVNIDFGGSLEELAAEAGDVEADLRSRDNDSKGAFVHPFDDGEYHTVKIMDAELRADNFGGPQVQLVLESTATGKTAKEWIDFPAQEGLTGMTPRAGGNLQGAIKRTHELLAAINPQTFKVVGAVVEVAGKKKYMDPDGNVMTYKQKETREKLLAKATLGTANKIAKGELDIKEKLVGAVIQYQRKPNPNKPKRPYINLRAVEG